MSSPESHAVTALTWIPPLLDNSLIVALLCFGVEGGSRLVQDQQQRVLAHQTPSKGDELPLSARELHATEGSSQLRLKALVSDTASRTFAEFDTNLTSNE